MENFDKAFQTHVVSAIYKSMRARKQLIPILKPEYFEFIADRLLVKLARKYFKEYRDVPSKVVVKQKLDEEHHDYVDKVFKRKLRGISILIDEVHEFVQRQEIKSAYYRSAELIEEGNLRDAYGLIRKAFANQGGEESTGSFAKANLARNLFDIVKQSSENAVPTGYPHLDKWMDGGLFPGELGVIMAKLKLGKSFWLLNSAFAAASMLSGKNVVFYSLENSRWKTLRRLYRRIIHDPVITVESQDSLRIRMNRFMPGDVYVQYFPTGRASVSDIAAHMDYLVDYENYKADIVFVDYSDCVKPERNVGERRFELNAIFEDLRGLAGEFDVPVWTATQTRRVGFDKKIVQADDSSESIGKPQIADVFLTLSQSKEEEDKDIILMNLAAMRESPGNRVIKLRKDYRKSLLYSVGDVEVYDVLNDAADEKKNKSKKKRLKDGKDFNIDHELGMS